MNIADRLSDRIAQEIAARRTLIDQSAGGSVQFTVQLDAAGQVKQVKMSIQVASNGVIPK
jgi:hypothetical protein